MLKKILIASSILIILMVFLIPSGADPTDVVLDQQVELEVPGIFDLVDKNHDGRSEGITFALGIKAYQEGRFIITGNLEAMKDGHWLAISTTVLPFEWSPEHKTVELTFHAGNIKKLKRNGPYRVIITLKAGNWELPAQVAGFSPKYNWNIFNGEGEVEVGEITTLSKAKRAVETWAAYKAIKLGKLIGIDYNYDHWQLDYNEGYGKTLRFLVNPRGTVEVLKINKSSRNRDWSSQ